MGVMLLKWSSLPEETAERFQLPADVIAGRAKITVTGKCRVAVENHRGLLEYSPEMVCISVRRGSVRITGENLELRAMDAGALVVTGEVRELELL